MLLKYNFEIAADVVPALINQLDEFDMAVKSYGIKLI